MTLVPGAEGSGVYRSGLPWFGPVAIRRTDLLVAGVAVGVTATTGLAETGTTATTQRRLFWMHLGLAAVAVGMSVQRARRDTTGSRLRRRTNANRADRTSIRRE